MTLRFPLILLFLVQTCLLFSSLDLLPAWGDEAFTLNTVGHPVREIVPIVKRDIHPPLYFLLAHAWSKLPLPWSGLARIRAFSALCALLATFLLDWFWTRYWEPGARRLALGLFALSPCLLLYGRMARSYTMQMALVVLVLGLVQRWMKRPDSWVTGAGAAVATIALLYTHYIPGIALTAGVMLLGWRALGVPRMAAFGLGAAAGYAPWAISLLDAIDRWRQASNFSSSYASTGSLLREQVLKLAYGAVSLTIGESFFWLSLALVPAMLWVAWRGSRGLIFGILSIAAVIGYLGVAHWVSYPFIPARMLWLLPFLVVAAAEGIATIPWPQLRSGVAAAILISFVSSDVLYFCRESFLDPGYNSPVREIAAALNAQARAGDLILLDSYNTDFQALQVYLRSPAHVVILGLNATATGAGTVWVVRNTRDVSPGHSTTNAESAACAGKARKDSFLEPYAEWQRTAMNFAGIRPAPQYFYQLTRCTAQ